MRDPNRLAPFYDEIGRIHAEYFPDWRVGQWWGNFFGWLYTKKGIDLYFPEEEEMLNYIKEYVKEMFNEKERED